MHAKLRSPNWYLPILLRIDRCQKDDFLIGPKPHPHQNHHLNNWPPHRHQYPLIPPLHSSIHPNHNLPRSKILQEAIVNPLSQNHKDLNTLSFVLIPCCQVLHLHQHLHRGNSLNHLHQHLHNPPNHYLYHPHHNPTYSMQLPVMNPQ